MSTRDTAIKELLGRLPSKRFKADTVLARLTERYPGQMHVVAHHLAQRIEEAGGDDCPAGRRLAILMEGELLALRNILLGEVIEDGLVAGDKEHKFLRTALRISDQVARMTNVLGLDPPPNNAAPINVKELWGMAPGSDTDTDSDTHRGTE